MKTRFVVANMILAASLTLTGIVTGHEPEASAPSSTDQVKTPGQGMPVFVQNIDPGATDAVTVVDAFSAGIKTVRLDRAKELLDPQVLVLESGGSERSRDEYMREHAAADALFLQNVQQQMRYRQARIEGLMAWVGTESELSFVKDGKSSLILSTETMVLRKTAQGWKIVHIHWSSRPGNPEKVK